MQVSSSIRARSSPQYEAIYCSETNVFCMLQGSPSRILVGGKSVLGFPPQATHSQMHF